MALRFAILRHDGVETPHYDLLFETMPGSDLATWRSPVWPIIEPTEVVKLRDHRRAYLQFEGALSGGRGQVYRVAEGECEVEQGQYRWLIREIVIPGEIPTAGPGGGFVLQLLADEGERWIARPGV